MLNITNKYLFVILFVIPYINMYMTLIIQYYFINNINLYIPIYIYIYIYIWKL